MAPLAEVAQIKRQYYDSEDLDNTTSSLPEPIITETSALAAAPESTAAPPAAPKGQPFTLTIPAIVGIVCGGLLVFGIGACTPFNAA
jgi:hypothetical protein